jgi:RNA polymerase sigma factor (sigma-70 family)
LEYFSDNMQENVFLVLHLFGFHVYLYVDVLLKQMSEEILITTFTKLRQRLLRLAKGIVANDDEASDALQDAFCRLWPRREDIDSSEKAQALTVVTVRNLCLDSLRKRRDVYTLDEAQDSPPVESDQERLEREERFRLIEQWVDEALTPVQRTIFRRKEFEGESVEQIAASLSMQEAAVRMNLSRARKTIRELYNKWTS